MTGTINSTNLEDIQIDLLDHHQGVLWGVWDKNYHRKSREPKVLSKRLDSLEILWQS